MSKARARREPSVDDFVVLLVEDEVPGDARKALNEIEGAFLVEAATPDDAKALIDHHYVDAAVIDLELQGVRGAGCGWPAASANVPRARPS